MTSKKVLVTFTEEQYESIIKIKGQLGRNDADTVRNIVMFWLVDKGLI